MHYAFIGGGELSEFVGREQGKMVRVTVNGRRDADSAVSSRNRKAVAAPRQISATIASNGWRDFLQ